MIDDAARAGRLLRQGMDLVLDWADETTARLQNWRDGRDGIRGELTVTQNGTTHSWGMWNLSSTVTRDQLAKRLLGMNPQIPWGLHLEEAAVRFTRAARETSPLTTLGDIDASDNSEELLPNWLYAGEPTLLYADGDTGKSMTALALAVAMQTGTALPGLQPCKPVPTAYLDWETSRATINRRLWLLAGGLGIDPPHILYKRMVRPVVEGIGPLSAELARANIGFVVVDSQMFATAGTDHGAFHEPITAMYTALRCFAPAAVLVLNHVINADARLGEAPRPFGGAFAFNSPRVIWQAKRQWDQDGTAIVFTCKKANNLERRPQPFGLRFRSTAFPYHGLRVEPYNP